MCFENRPVGSQSTKSVNLSVSENAIMRPRLENTINTYPLLMYIRNIAPMPLWLPPCPTILSPFCPVRSMLGDDFNILNLIHDSIRRRPDLPYIRRHPVDSLRAGVLAGATHPVSLTRLVGARSNPSSPFMKIVDQPKYGLAHYCRRPDLNRYGRFTSRGF